MDQIGGVYKPKNKGGRPKGSITKDRKMLMERAQALGIDPFEILLRFAAGDWKGLGYDSDTITKYTAKGDPYEEDRISPDHRITAALGAARHILPTLKAIDVSTEDGSGLITMNLTVGGHETTRQPEPSGADKPTA